MTLTTNQTLAGIKDIKLSSRETYFRDLSIAAYDIVTGAHARLNVWHETPSLIMQGLAQITLVTLALIFWKMGLDKGQIATQLGLLIIVTTKVIPTVSSLSSAVSGLFNTFPHVHAIRETLGSIEAETRRTSRKEGIGKAIPSWSHIRFQEVGYQYPNSSDWAIKDMTLSLTRAGSYGVVGPSAAGKSTFVDLLVGLLEPTAGQICVGEDSLRALKIKEWQKRIAYVPQMPFIADDSLRANIAFGVRQSEVDDKWVMNCLRLANLASLSEDLKQGLATKLGERGLRLSGGQRQRIAIARALFNRPEILVLDEATSALDSLTESEILATLKNLHGQVTTITVAHRLSTVASCDEIFVLEAGRLVGRGSYAELRANHELFQRMAAAGV
jgi:ATP-binding cassette subfamily C protein